MARPAKQRLHDLGDLREVGFSGWISIEDGMDGLGEIARSAEFLKHKRTQYFG
jgi:sugar phosphate isomerase/epimerase